MEMRVSRYRLLEAVTAKELEGMVNEMIAEGWQPYEGPSFNGIYMQAVVRERPAECPQCGAAPEGKGRMAA